ncbi:hypothetical protein DY023_01215 [Microbacterium bovistercoris]|uniref:DUF4352 domain-containing protein n=1 Tax=Microbacterium bovistercoris TaxID=2293570 RepID=A0A371NY26_9MICO|nr:hypothetical protein [Microbacterium bovistercoris]REJ08380.1 hypothetical protein DY023_01215 [Microbacterium bovistercoris]
MGENDEADADATGPADADAAGPADADAAGRAESEARLTSWVRKTTDKVPTGWIITGAGAILLGATAAFGGLGPQPEPKPAEISIGEHYVGSELDMSVVSAAVGGEISDPDDGLRTLEVVMDVTNEYTEPRLGRSPHTMGGVGVEGVTLDGVDVERVADDSGVLYFQPDVPTRVRLTWTIEEGDVNPGDEIRIILPDSTRFQGSFVTRGTYWDDIRPGAYVTVQVDELPAEDAP